MTRDRERKALLEAQAALEEPSKWWEVLLGNWYLILLAAGMLAAWLESTG